VNFMHCRRPLRSKIQSAVTATRGEAKQVAAVISLGSLLTDSVERRSNQVERMRSISNGLRSLAEGP
jgi:RNase P/RNase MRP subunit p30